MKFSTKFRGRSSSHIFTRSSKLKPAVEAKTVTEPVKSEPVEKTEPAVEEPVVDQLSDDKVDADPAAETAVQEAPVEETTVKDVDAFPNIHVDARQEEDEDSVSIQTEQREDVRSIDSIMTEYEEAPGEIKDGAESNTIAAAADAAVVVADEEGSSPESSSAQEEKIELTAPSNGCRASCAMGLSHIHPPNMEKPIAVMKECKDSLSKRFEEARPGLEQRAGEMKTSIVEASTKAGTSIAAGAIVVGSKTGETIVNASTRAGGIVKRFACGDERTLQYHAKEQEQVVSPKQEVTSHVAAADVISPSRAALGKYTLSRLVCGSYKCSDCAHDLAVGAVDILCLGFCDCDNSKDNAKTGEFDELSDTLSPVMSPNTYGDSTTRAFTFDTLDSCGDFTQITDVISLNMNLNLSKAAMVAENRALMLQSVELTEGDHANFVKSAIFSPSDATIKTGSTSWESSALKINPNPNETENNTSIELVGEGLTPKPKSSRRMSFFRKKAPEYKVNVVEDNKKDSGSYSDSQKTGSTGGSTTHVNNSNGMALSLEKTKKRPKKGSKPTKCSE